MTDWHPQEQDVQTEEGQQDRVFDAVAAEDYCALALVRQEQQQHHRPQRSREPADAWDFLQEPVAIVHVVHECVSSWNRRL